MRRYYVQNITDKTDSGEVEAPDRSKVIEIYIAGLNPDNYSNEEWEALPDNLLISEHEN